MNYRMIVLDLDGTLTNSEKKVTSRTREALIEAQRQGNLVALASGRTPYGIRPVAEELQLERYGGYMLPFNGGIMIDCRTGREVFSRMLPVESNRKIIGLAKTYSVHLVTYEGQSAVISDPNCPHSLFEARNNHLAVHAMESIEAMQDYVNFPVPKFLLCGDGDYLEKVEPEVRDIMGEGFSVYRSDPFFLEVLPAGVDKASSIERLLRLTGLERGQVIACGDAYNDISMIRYAGLGVAMENALPAVKEAADYITLSNDEDGVAAVVKKFMLL